MWITEDVYEKIGEKLQDEYNKLPKSYKGITRVDTIMAEGRVGVCVVEDFYKKYTGSGDGRDYSGMTSIEDCCRTFRDGYSSGLERADLVVTSSDCDD